MKHFKKNLRLFIHYFDNKKGFSFIEILVAVTIFAILVIVALLNFTVSGQKSRDAKRTADIMGLRTAIELYNLGEGDYPLNSDLDDCGEPLTGLNGTYLETIPCDPETNSAYGYHFDTGTGTYYIGATMELANSQNQNCEELNAYLGLSSPSPSSTPGVSPSPSASVDPSVSPSPVDCTAEGQFCSGLDCPSCCAGLVSIDSCMPPDCDCTGGHYCTNCGNGVCGTGENYCNCPADCPSPSPSPSPTLEQLTCENSGGSWIPGGCDPCDGSACREVMTYGCDCGTTMCWDGSTCTTNPVLPSPSIITCPTGVNEGDTFACLPAPPPGPVCSTCCSGLTKINYCDPVEGYCLGSLYVCTQCGNGECGIGENIYNCSKDCF